MKFVGVIQNANGGLHVGLCIEPIVSYFSEKKVKMLMDILWDFLEEIELLWRKNFERQENHGFSSLVGKKD